MNREIKFRAWREIENRMYQPITELNFDAGYYSYHGLDIETGVSPEFQFTDTPLMQYTGLKDKNGVEIYEGDLLKLDRAKGVFEVKYFGDSFVIKKTIWGKNRGFWSLCWGHDEIKDTLDATEVIGNIYENNKIIK